MNKAEIAKSWEHKLRVIEGYSEPLPVLDHGHIRLVDLMGDDTAIVQAARVSYGRGESRHAYRTSAANSEEVECTTCGIVIAKGDPKDGHCDQGDRRLIRYLMRQRHSSPLEMCEIKLHIKMPIFVARQWIRHRTASTNEYSMRYSPAIEEFYLIAADGWRSQSATNKQGSEGTIGVAYGREMSLASLDTHREQLAAYERKIRLGVAREIARCDLPLSMYTEWYWKVDLHNLLHFLSLRMDSHAQYEIRVFADALAEMVKLWVPHTWEAFTDYRLGAAHFSRQELELLQYIASGDLPPTWWQYDGSRKATFDRHGIETVRERVAFLKKLGLT